MHPRPDHVLVPDSSGAVGDIEKCRIVGKRPRCDASKGDGSLTALFNYGWTGILGFLAIFLTTKYSQHIEVHLWVGHLKRTGATKREIRDYVLGKATSESTPELLAQIARGSTGGEADPPSTLSKGGPVAPARPRKSSRPANPTTPAKRTTASKQAPKADTPAKAQPAKVTQLPEPSTGRHAKPDNEENAEVRQFPGAKEDPSNGRHSVA
jgi:hypothetical protein